MWQDYIATQIVPDPTYRSKRWLQNKLQIPSDNIFSILIHVFGTRGFAKCRAIARDTSLIANDEHLTNIIIGRYNLNCNYNGRIAPRYPQVKLSDTVLWDIYRGKLIKLAHFSDSIDACRFALNL